MSVPFLCFLFSLQKFCQYRSEINSEKAAAKVNSDVESSARTPRHEILMNFIAYRIKQAKYKYIKILVFAISYTVIAEKCEESQKSKHGINGKMSTFSNIKINIMKYYLLKVS